MDCMQEGCTGSARKKGYCERHYRQRRIAGEVGWDGSVCLEDGCDKPTVSKQRCHYHYGVFHRAEVAAGGSCSIEGCDSPLFSGGWCQRHYARNLRWGDPLAWKKPTRRPCEFQDCERQQVAHGYCDMHYRRIKRHGTPELPSSPVFRDPPPLTCRQCGDPIVNVPGKPKRRTYCSEQCAIHGAYWYNADRKLLNQLRPYGLTVEEFRDLLARQDGRCAICRVDDPGVRGTWHIDHCHESNKVRGLLCGDCNIGLGHFKDKSDVLRSAADHLDRSCV